MTHCRTISFGATSWRISALPTPQPRCTLIVAKWGAAEISGRSFGFDATDRLLTTSLLTLPQVAATLATALVGYGAVNAAGERLSTAGC